MFYIALDGLLKMGICPESRMPYARKSDPDREPSAEAVEEARSLSGRWQIHWIKRWALDDPLDGGQLLEIKRALAAGHPVACGMRWPKKLRGAQLLEVPEAKEVFDGHSIMLVGYQDDENGGGILRFRNSFGEGWGESGYNTLSSWLCQSVCQ